MTGTRVILHTYWPNDRPEDLRTRVLPGDSLADVCNGLEDWWKSPIDWQTTTRTLDGWLVQRRGRSEVALVGGYSVLWTHIVYLSERTPSSSDDSARQEDDA